MFDLAQLPDLLFLLFTASLGWFAAWQVQNERTRELRQLCDLWQHEAERAVDVGQRLARELKDANATATYLQQELGRRS